MKVQYLGDVNDYRKYALLRLLAGSGLKIGINWLLTADDGRPDGNKRSYLSQREKWQTYDPDLFDMLAEVPLVPTPHDLREIERQGVIPGAVYLDLPVPRGLAAREGFHAASMQAFGDCNLVFFDPDNGLAPASVSKARSAGVKFVFDDELASHFEAGRSLLVYQHFPRVERTDFMTRLGSRLRAFASQADIWACHTSHVVFMLVANPSQLTTQSEVVSAAIDDGRSRWPDTFIRFVHLDTA